MFRTCPATGYLQCHFDRETHQCKCGRWQRGYAPAKVVANAKPRNECQICERKQALDASGKLGNHGYKRPGWGFIVGNCPGVDHLPFPETDALVRYLVRCVEYEATTVAELAALPLATEFKVTVSRRVGRYPNETKEEKTVVVTKPVDPTAYHYNSYRPEEFYVPSFADELRIRTTRAERELGNVREEIKRVTARIAKGNALRGGK